jgi:hypothetical protein
MRTRVEDCTNLITFSLSLSSSSIMSTTISLEKKI